MADSRAKTILLCLTFLLASVDVTARITSPLARDGGRYAKQTCLPTGACLDPAGRSLDVGNMPLTMALSPEGDRLVLSLNGWREQGLQVVDFHAGTIVQTIS